MNRSNIPCRYGAKCTLYPNCEFYHSPEHIPRCPFMDHAPGCTNIKCKFYHPPGFIHACILGDKCTKGSECKFDHRFCSSRPVHHDHLVRQDYHPPSRQDYHPPSRQDYHPPSRQDYRPSSRQDYHPPSRQDYHPPSRQDYHPPSRQDYRPPSRQDYRPPSRQDYRPPSRQDYRPPSRQDYRPPSRPVSSRQDYRSSSRPVSSTSSEIKWDTTKPFVPSSASEYEYDDSDIEDMDFFDINGKKRGIITPSGDMIYLDEKGNQVFKIEFDGNCRDANNNLVGTINENGTFAEFKSLIVDCSDPEGKYSSKKNDEDLEFKEMIAELYELNSDDEYETDPDAYM